MNNKGISYLKLALCIYLIISGVCLLAFYVFNLGPVGLLISLWPSLIVLLITGIYIHSGYSGLRLSNQESSYTYQQIAFLIQAVSLKILGVTFENSFGPRFGIGFTDTPTFDWIVDFKLFAVGLYNGYNKNSDEVLFILNLFPLLLGYLISLRVRAEKTQESDSDLEL